MQLDHQAEQEQEENPEAYQLRSRTVQRMNIFETANPSNFLLTDGVCPILSLIMLLSLSKIIINCGSAKHYQ
jgi:hypothetical protein